LKSRKALILKQKTNCSLVIENYTDFSIQIVATHGTLINCFHFSKVLMRFQAEAVTFDCRERRMHGEKNGQRLITKTSEHSAQLEMGSSRNSGAVSLLGLLAKIKV
jgi:hypothetical protein